VLKGHLVNKKKIKNYQKHLIGQTRLKSSCCGYQRQKIGKMDIKGFMSDFGNTKAGNII
jgi:hypothetical protein